MSSRNGCFKKKRSKVRELNIQKYGCLTCEYCDNNNLTTTPHKKNTATIDHLVPLSAGGNNSWENLKLVCSKCNNKKNQLCDLRGLVFDCVIDLKAFLSRAENK